MSFFTMLMTAEPATDAPAERLPPAAIVSIVESETAIRSMLPLDVRIEVSSAYALTVLPISLYAAPAPIPAVPAMLTCPATDLIIEVSDAFIVMPGTGPPCTYADVLSEVMSLSEMNASTLFSIQLRDTAAAKA